MEGEEVTPEMKETIICAQITIDEEGNSSLCLKYGGDEESVLD
jgi:hypothetical protein